MEDAYEKIGSIVEQWCEENMYTTMLVTISIGYEWETPHEETHLLDWDFNSLSLIWDIDWWEGQQHVELVGFTPTYKIRLVGADAEVAPVQRWIPVTERLPGKGVRVLVTDGIDVDTSWLFGDPVRWVTAKIDVEDERITHWMPLPEPPMGG